MTQEEWESSSAGRLAKMELPGDLTDDLLRTGSPVWCDFSDGQPRVKTVVVEITAYWAECALGISARQPLDALSLDLTDPTGRIHAAWWISKHVMPPGLPTEIRDIITGIWVGEDLTDAEIAAFAAYCLKVGRC